VEYVVTAALVFLQEQVAADRRRAERMEHWAEEMPSRCCPATRSKPLGDLPFGEDECDCGLRPRRRRALAECDVKLAIIAEHPPCEGAAIDSDGRLSSGLICATCATTDLAGSLEGDPYPCKTIRLLVDFYAVALAVYAVVASSDSDPATKADADFVCTGTADEKTIQAAINAAVSRRLP